MSSTQSNEEIHAARCALRNVWTAATFVACSALMLYLNWRDLDKPFQEPRGYDVFWHVVTIPAFWKLLQIFTCYQERLVIVLGMLGLIREIAVKLFPGFLIPFSGPIRDAFHGLWAGALLISVTLLFSAMSQSRATSP